MLRRLQRMGLRRGVFGTSTPWLYIGAASWAIRTLRRMAARKPEVLLHEELEPGQRLVITNRGATVEDG